VTGKNKMPFGRAGFKKPVAVEIKYILSGRPIMDQAGEAPILYIRYLFNILKIFLKYFFVKMQKE
jgi:hypothetical protein